MDYFRIITQSIYCYLQILILNIFVETGREKVKKSRVFGKASGDVSIISCVLGKHVSPTE